MNKAQQETIPLGVIDSLAAGFHVVARHPWLFLLPVLVDTFLWLGPRLSMYPIVQTSLSWLASTSSEVSEEAQVSQYIAFLEEASQRTNLFALLVNTMVGLPSLVTPNRLVVLLTPPRLFEHLPFEALPAGVVPATLEINNVLLLSGVSILLVLSGLFLAFFYLTLMARVVREGRTDLAQIWKHTWACWWRLGIVAGVITAMGLALSLPFTALLALIALAGQEVALFVMAFLVLGLLWVSAWLYFYLYFFFDALALGNNPSLIDALRGTFHVVRRNVSSTLGLIVLTKLIAAGLYVIWLQLADKPWGVGLSIAGNAFIGSGLVAATLIFYWGRYTQLANPLSPIRVSGR